MIEYFENNFGMDSSVIVRDDRLSNNILTDTRDGKRLLMRVRFDRTV
jgi:hypothetical protein